MVDYASSRSVARSRPSSDLVSIVRRLDLLLLGAVVAVVAYGIWGVAGITRYDVVGDEGYYVTRQLFAAGIGCIGLLLVLAIDPDVSAARRTLHLCGDDRPDALVYPLAQETAARGAGSTSGSFQFQPSEFGKLLFVIALAGFLVDRVRRLQSPVVVLQAVALGAIPIVLVFRAARHRHRARLRRRSCSPVFVAGAAGRT